ncbi:hypothetical protein RND81_13G037800 [Saponaria officinalis]|uniref:Glycosyltransferase n=1 Tax=Saponaria officinalis TaxID=3572 RepID=A0AAW1GZ83_SAPOF
MSPKNDIQLHIAMYPWLAMGHITPFLHIANKLAKRGQSYNYGNNIARTNDVPPESRPLLMTAMDLTQDTIEVHLINLNPDFIFYDFAYWIPELGRKHGIKSIYYSAILLVGITYTFHIGMSLISGQPVTKERLTSPLPSFPYPFIKFKAHEVPCHNGIIDFEFGGGLTFFERFGKSLIECDAIGIKTCKEIDGVYCEYIEKRYGKPVLTAGPMILDLPANKLEDWVDQWLAGFGSAEVVYCAFGSECTLEKAQFQELVLGLELADHPFLAALKAPRGYETIESALPEGFTERTKGRGIVYGGWVQQQLILQHPSIGCFITHCGAGSLSEAMVNKCQIVMIPNFGDQGINARMMSYELKVGVEVDKREEDGFYTREDVQKAVATVMDEDSEVGKEVRANHTKWREFILKDGVEDSYITGFIQSLQQLLKETI